LRARGVMLRNEPAQFSDRIEAERDCRKRALRSDLIDPTIAVHHRKVVKRTGDGILVEFRSVVDAGSKRRGRAQCGPAARAPHRDSFNFGHTGSERAPGNREGKTA
jgi:hypothetical protein